LKMGLFLL